MVLNLCAVVYLYTLLYNFIKEFKKFLNEIELQNLIIKFNLKQKIYFLKIMIRKVINILAILTLVQKMKIILNLDKKNIYFKILYNLLKFYNIILYFINKY